jgi:type IV pilus assembly protein PilB
MTPAPISVNQTLADVLLKHQAITEQSYNLIKSEHLNTGARQEEIIAKRNLADPRALVQAKAELNQTPFVDVRTVSSNPQALTFIPQSVAQRFKAFPYGYVAEEKQLSVAMVDPLDISALDFLRQKSGCRVVAAYGYEEDLLGIINEKYAQTLSTEVTAAIEETQKTKSNVLDAESIKDVIREAPIAKIVSTLLGFAMKSQASDIHIEPLEDKTRVRYRIDGILHEKLVLPKSVHDAVVSRIKILSRMKIDEKRVPQDGRFSFRNESQEVDLRVSSLPTVNGEKIVMRLLKKGGTIPTLSELGLRGRGLKNLEEFAHRANGIVLVTGPTGSGKTTTLYSTIHLISNVKVNIMTLEDPVEYEMEGISQVQTNPQAGLTFASGLRSFLRQDPDIIMVGEIRDTETAELSVHASLTGHLVFSTLHTNSASGAIPRLIDMEIEPFLLASAINCIVGQRVVRKICEHCKEPYVPEPSVVETIQKELGPLFAQYQRKQVQIYRGRKCPQCNDTGYTGRVGIFEVMPMTEQIGKLTISRAPASDIQNEALKSGMLTMTMDGYLKVLDGITTVEEVLRVSHQ